MTVSTKLIPGELIKIAALLCIAPGWSPSGKRSFNKVPEKRWAGSMSKRNIKIEQ
jgi:hypothetical protein